MPPPASKRAATRGASGGAAGQNMLSNWKQKAKTALDASGLSPVAAKASASISSVLLHPSSWPTLFKSLSMQMRVAAVAVLCVVVCALLGSCVCLCRCCRKWFCPRSRGGRYRNVRAANYSDLDDDSDEAEALNGRSYKPARARFDDRPSARGSSRPGDHIVTLDPGAESERDGYEAEAEERINF